MSERRYPFAPLAVATGLSEHQATVHLGLSGSTAQQYRREGMSERVADRLAVKAGLHPFEVWPEMADDALADTSKSCGGCGGLFVPVREGHRFCSATCRRRANERRARELNLPSAETKRAYRRRYYEQCGDYERARQRRYDQARRVA